MNFIHLKNISMLNIFNEICSHIHGRLYEDGLRALNPGITEAQVDRQVERGFADWFKTHVSTTT